MKFEFLLLCAVKGSQIFSDEKDKFSVENCPAISPILGTERIRGETQDSGERSKGKMSVQTKENLKRKVKNMFDFSYQNYLKFGLPKGELKPVSCAGGYFNDSKIDYLTLYDALDTLVVMDDHHNFRRGVEMLTENVKNFEIDQNVSLFETNIRVLGGLLSAHLLATDAHLNIYGCQNCQSYKGELLDLAVDLADRLVPAFDTATGIPFGTVNLKYGVPKNETTIACLAGGGTLAVEMSVLSELTGNDTYCQFADKAQLALQKRRTPIGLFGGHIDNKSGAWKTKIGGLGAGIDSFYEYQFKMYLLWGRRDYWDIFLDNKKSIDRYFVRQNWLVDCNINSGVPTSSHLESLAAFWPAILVSLGDIYGAAELVGSFLEVRKNFGLLPEKAEISILKSSPGSEPKEISERMRRPPTGKKLGYPLRPELIESIHALYRATKDESLLWEAADILNAIEEGCRAECGYAAVSDVRTMALLDEMPSYFLAETLKYFYLLFDEDNFIHKGDYVFSTEAHLFNIKTLRKSSHESKRPNCSRSVLEISPKYEGIQLQSGGSKEQIKYASQLQEMHQKMQCPKHTFQVWMNGRGFD